MAKAKTVFFCTNCGNESPKWMGRCPGCGAFNTMQEHIEKPVPAGKAKPAPVGQSRTPQRLREVTGEGEIRFSTGMGELNRVLGGGAVAGSLVLVGGAPGIGKSTLLLQICTSLCAQRKVLYISGEESERQLKLRAERLGVNPEELYILSETRLSDVLEAVEATKPDILIVDSIQTLYLEDNESSPGSVSQVKDCTMTLMNLSKSQGITVFVVGHINKDGNIAGPKVLEHMVDCVLYFEGDPIPPTGCSGLPRTASALPMKSAFLRCWIPVCRRFPTPARCCWRAVLRVPAAPVWPVSWREPGLFWQRFRHWYPKPPSMYPGAPQTDSISTGRRCCWRWVKSGAA